MDNEVYVDANGFEYSPAEAAYLIQNEGFYLEADRSEQTTYKPDTANEHGLRDRDVWPEDQIQRSQARHEAMRRMLKERG